MKSTKKGKIYIDENINEEEHNNFHHSNNEFNDCSLSKITLRKKKKIRLIQNPTGKNELNFNHPKSKCKRSIQENVEYGEEIMVSDDVNNVVSSSNSVKKQNKKPTIFNENITDISQNNQSFNDNINTEREVSCRLTSSLIDFENKHKRKRNKVIVHDDLNHSELLNNTNESNNVGINLLRKDKIGCSVDQYKKNLKKQSKTESGDDEEVNFPERDKFNLSFNRSKKKHKKKYLLMGETGLNESFSNEISMDVVRDKKGKESPEKDRPKKKQKKQHELVGRNLSNDSLNNVVSTNVMSDKEEEGLSDKDKFKVLSNQPKKKHKEKHELMGRNLSNDSLNNVVSTNVMSDIEEEGLSDKDKFKILSNQPKQKHKKNHVLMDEKSSELLSNIPDNNNVTNICTDVDEYPIIKHKYKKKKKHVKEENVEEKELDHIYCNLTKKSKKICDKFESQSSKLSNKYKQNSDLNNQEELNPSHSNKNGNCTIDLITKHKRHHKLDKEDLNISQMEAVPPSTKQEKEETLMSSIMGNSVSQSKKKHVDTPIKEDCMNDSRNEILNHNYDAKKKDKCFSDRVDSKKKLNNDIDLIRNKLLEKFLKNVTTNVKTDSPSKATSLKTSKTKRKHNQSPKTNSSNILYSTTNHDFKKKRKKVNDINVLMEPSEVVKTTSSSSDDQIFQADVIDSPSSVSPLKKVKSKDLQKNITNNMPFIKDKSFSLKQTGNDIEKIQRSLISVALQKLNSVPEPSKSHKKVLNPQEKSKEIDIHFNQNIIKRKEKKLFPDVSDDKANSKKRKKAKTVNSIEDITSRMLSTALASKKSSKDSEIS